MMELVEFAQVDEPRMIAPSVYLDTDRTQVTFFLMQLAWTSPEFHLRVAVSRFPEFTE